MDSMVQVFEKMKLLRASFFIFQRNFSCFFEATLVNLISVLKLVNLHEGSSKFLPIGLQLALFVNCENNMLVEEHCIRPSGAG
jgi:hypothetical protein